MVVACTAAIGGAIAVTSAYAATPGVAELTGANGTTLEYTARSGDKNDVHITVVNTIGGQRFEIDDRVDITPGNGCFHPDSSDRTKVRCTFLNVRKIKVDVGNGDDVVTNDTSTSSTLTGGTGDDYMFGGSASDDLFGNDGNDYLDGRAGTDALIGGSGGDFLYGQAGDDSLLGEAGSDYLDGGDGDDLVRGGDNNDRLFGGNGRDRLEGEGGDDQIEGNANNDELNGGPGTDTLNGGPHDAAPGDNCVAGEIVSFCNP
jgi:serralysin